MPNANSRKHNGKGCGLNAAFCIGQGSLLTLNTNGCVPFSHLCGLKKTRGGHRGAHRTSQRVTFFTSPKTFLAS